MKYQPCEVCGHVFGEKHRLIPGKIGGRYDAVNVLWLCPNHHAALHFVLDAHANGGARDMQRHQAYLADAALMSLASAIRDDYRSLGFLLAQYNCRKVHEVSQDIMWPYIVAVLRTLQHWRDRDLE